MYHLLNALRPESFVAAKEMSSVREDPYSCSKISAQSEKTKFDVVQEALCLLFREWKRPDIYHSERDGLADSLFVFHRHQLKSLPGRRLEDTENPAHRFLPVFC